MELKDWSRVLRSNDLRLATVVGVTTKRCMASTCHSPCSIFMFCGVQKLLSSLSHITREVDDEIPERTHPALSAELSSFPFALL